MLDRSDPDPFLDSFTGVEALHERHSEASELAERLGLDPLGTETLVTALTTPWRVVVVGRRP